jgi:hypothetical protein
VLLAVVCSVLGVACSEEEPKKAAQEGPDVVVAELLRRLRRVHGTPEAGQQVVDLLWEPARKNLQERASRASAVSSRELEVGEMLAPSWLSFHLDVERFEWRRQGDWAEVRGIGADGSAVTTRCVLEGDQWKVVLELPPVPPIRLRPDEAQARERTEPESDLSYPREPFQFRP